MAIEDRILEEHTAYIGAFHFILTQLQIREFRQSDDPLAAATATAGHVKQTLLQSGLTEDPMTQIVVEFFDQIVEDMKSMVQRDRPQ